MPIYEFYCKSNNKIYTFFARSLSYAGMTPRCPDNPKFPMERLVSSFSVTGRAQEKSEADAFPVDDTKMEKLMAEMEQEFSGDEQNPDPRKLARMMRKMSNATGEAMPAGMQEMLQRMEAGEDPEKLEAEYGDSLEGLDVGQGEGENGAKGKTRARRLPPPRRDPVLYDMADYIRRLK